MSRFLIYGLVDPRTNEVRYVGRSSSGLVRPKHHSVDARPTIVVLEKFDREFSEASREKRRLAAREQWARVKAAGGSTLKSGADNA